MNSLVIASFSLCGDCLCDFRTKFIPGFNILFRCSVLSLNATNKFIKVYDVFYFVFHFYDFLKYCAHILLFLRLFKGLVQYAVYSGTNFQRFRDFRYSFSGEFTAFVYPPHRVRLFLNNFYASWSAIHVCFDWPSWCDFAENEPNFCCLGVGTPKPEDVFSIA